MKLPTPEHIKSAVIDAWLIGKTRDNIASEYNISTGSVSNIIEQWQNRIGLFDANNLRELGLGLKKAGMSPIQCVNGLRINNIINQLGIDEDHLFDFLKKLYNESKEQRLLPGDLCEFSDINAYRDLVENKNRKLKELESDIQNLKEIFDGYERKIASDQKIVQSLNKLDNLGFDTSVIKKLEMVF
jgi:hypothetical protein